MAIGSLLHRLAGAASLDVNLTHRADRADHAPLVRALVDAARTAPALALAA